MLGNNVWRLSHYLSDYCGLLHHSLVNIQVQWHDPFSPVCSLCGLCGRTLLIPPNLIKREFSRFSTVSFLILAGFVWRKKICFFTLQIYNMQVCCKKQANKPPSQHLVEDSKTSRAARMLCRFSCHNSVLVGPEFQVVRPAGCCDKGDPVFFTYAMIKTDWWPGGYF